MFKNKSLKRALTNVAMEFEELRANILQNMDIWSGKTAERLQVIMAHWRQLQNNAVRLRQATRSLDDSNTKELIKLANRIQPCAFQLMREDEHLGEKAEILEHFAGDSAPADSAADITPEDSISNRDPKSPTTIKKKVKKSPTPIKKKSSSVKGAASVMSPVGTKKMIRPAAASVGSEFPTIFWTKAHDRTYLQADEKTSHQC